MRSVLLPLPALLAAGLMLPASASASAGKVLGEAWACAKSHVNAAGTIALDLYKKGEQVAALSATAGTCLVGSGADQQGFAITMAALTAIKVASPGSLPTGQCKNAVRKAVARPFGEGIAAVLPSGGVKSKLRELLDSEQATSTLWSQLAGLPPPVSTYASHVDCGCEFIDGGLSLADVSAVTSAVGAVSDKCAGFLDAAGLGFINDYGGEVIRLGKGVYAAAGGAWEDFKNDPKPAPDAAVYHGFWRAYVPNMAALLVNKPGSNLGTGKWSNALGGWISLGSGCYQASCQIDLPMMFKDCADYYRAHRFSDSHALSKCNEYQKRAVDEATTMAKQYQALLDVRTQTENRLKAAIESQWVWRLPYNASNVVAATYSKLDNRWTTPEAMKQVFAGTAGSYSAGGQYAAAWDYQASGVYASAREILPNVGYDPARAAELALGSATAGFQKELLQQWDKAGKDVRDYWLGRWFPTPPMGGTYGCPGDGLLRPACVAQLAAAFDASCLPPVRALHVESANVLAAGARIKTVEAQCRAAIEPQLARIGAIAGHNYGPYQSQVCGGLEPRSPAAGTCERLVSDTYYECALQTIKNGQTAAAMTGCMEAARPGIAARLAQGQRISPTLPPAQQPAIGGAQPTPPVGLKPMGGSRGTVVPADGGISTRQSAPVPAEAMRLDRAPQAEPTDARAPAQDGEPQETVERPSPELRRALRLPRAPVEASDTPTCARGETLQQQRDGSQRCVPVGE